MDRTAILFPNIRTFYSPKIKEFCRKDSFVVAIDGGAENAFKIHVIPHIVIGDMDSISSKTKYFIKKKRIEILQYAKEKDKTDFELTLDYLLSRGIRRIVFAGLSGERTDHVIANWMILADLYSKGYLESIKVVEKNQTTDFSKKDWKATVQLGDLVSIIPLPEGARGVITHGLKYKLRGENLKFGTSRGISNIAEEKNIRVKITGGSVMIVYRTFR